MSAFRDDKLDKLMTRIKESNNSNNKLLNYKKALARLDELKTEYNNLCSALKPREKSKSKSQSRSSEKSEDKVSMEKIISGLNKINEDLDSESTDMLALIDSYVQYKLLLDGLETESEKFKNEILKVEQTKGKISLTKINPDEIL